MKKYMRIFCVLLAFVMICGFLPMNSQAAYNPPVLSDGTKVLHAERNDSAADVFENPDEGMWPLYNVLSSAGEPIHFGGAWDRDYLYIAYENQEGITMAVTLNEVDVADISTKTGTSHTVVRVPLASAKVFMRDAGYSGKLVLTLGNKTWKGTVVCNASSYMQTNFDRKTLMSIPIYDPVIGLAKRIEADEIRGAEQVGNSLRFWSTAANPSSAAVGYNINGVDGLASSSVTNVIEFDLLATDLPEVAEARQVGFFICEGVVFMLQDDTCGSQTRNNYCFGISNIDGELNIVSDMHDTDYFDMGVSADEEGPIHIRIEYENQNAYYNSKDDFSDPTAKFYVNGVFIGEDEEVKSHVTTITGAANTLCVYGQPVAGKNLEFTLSNFKFSYLNPPMSDATSMSGLQIQDLLGGNLPDAVLNADLQLPKYRPGGKLNGVELQWKSDNENAITSDGKINPNADKLNATLTATIRGTAYRNEFSFVVTNQSVITPHTNRKVALDGDLKDSGWTYIRQLARGEELTLSFGTLWNGNDLYIGIEKIDVSELTLIVNGKQLENVQAATGESHTELRIPLDELGIAAAAGTSVPLTIQLGDQSWIGVVTLGDVFLFSSMQDVLSVVLIALVVAVLVLLIIALIRRSLFKKIWFLIVLAVLVLGCIGCAFGAFYDVPFAELPFSQR